MLANACSIPFGAVFRAGRDLSFYLYHIISGKIHESNTNHDGLESSVGEHTVAGGRLRVAYEGGLTVTCDGRHLVQYDPDTRTAQKVELARAVRDFPLLGILLEPARLERLYRVEAFGGEGLRLLPRETGLPELRATGRGGLLHTVEWTDTSGAKQKLELLDAKVPAAQPPSTFRPNLPTGTRWATPTG